MIYTFTENSIYIPYYNEEYRFEFELTENLKKLVLFNYDESTQSIAEYPNASTEDIQSVKNAIKMWHDGFDKYALDRAKKRANNLLDSISRFDEYKNDDMYLTSSLGFRINADARSQNNIIGLITLNQKSDKKITFKDYDNNFQFVSVDELKTLLSECYQNGNNLYQQKWAFKAQIERCTSEEELKKLIFNFKMMEFKNEIQNI
jgi:hypothetical protein